MDLTVRVQRLAHGRSLELPRAASEGSAGIDLRAAIEEDEQLVLAPGERALIPTGLAFEIPTGWEGQVRPRSGLAVRHGLALVNSPGTIDSDYRGEIKVLVINLGQEAVSLGRGQRIAQLVISPSPRVTLVEVESLEPTGRGSGGFGSTG
ncbi:MAG: dUTP diphosphatase [Acidobacteria bacterium]|nr:dUTP diphosphatase [Acidobacteriota bacterium]